MPISKIISEGGKYASRLIPALEALTQNKMTAEQARGQLRNFPGGVGAEELDYSGIARMLEGGGPVTKQGLLEQARSMPLQIEDVYKGDISPDAISRRVAQDTADEAELIVENDYGLYQRRDDILPAISRYREDPTRTNMLALRNEMGAAGHPLAEGDRLFGERMADRTDWYTRNPGELRGADNTKYGGPSYTLPGGEDYTELLMTMPNKSVSEQQARAILNAKPDAPLSAADIEYARRKGSPEFTSSHYDEPNILAHMRYSTRPVNGDQSLFLEEIQSDWHQAGREKGYQDRTAMAELDDAIKTKEAERDRANADYAAVQQPIGDIDSIDDIPAATDAESAAYANIERINDELSALKQQRASAGAGVPDAPYKKNWHELAFRRAVKEAVDKGLDRVAWTPGDVQADRYDLSKVIDQVEYSRVEYPDGTIGYELDVTAKQGPDPDIPARLKEDQLEDYLGKELSEKIIKGEGGKPEYSGHDKSLSGLDLKVGGEGMREFYDKILPYYVKDFGKKYGAKVEVKDIETDIAMAPYTVKTMDGEVVELSDSRESAQRWIDSNRANRASEYEVVEYGGGQPVWSMPITPKMRKAFETRGAPLAAAPIAPGLLSEEQDGPVTYSDAIGVIR